MSNNEGKLTESEKLKTSTESSVIHLKRARKRLIKWGIVVGSFLLTLLISLYFVSPYRLVNDISVSGSKAVYDQVILDSSGLTSGDSIWEEYMNKRKIEEKIVQENRQVAQAELSLSGIQDLVITIEEYRTVAYLSNDNKYKKILENGDILDEAVPRISANQPILNGFEEGPPLEWLIDEYEKVDADVQTLISEIDYLQHDRNDMLISVFMNDGNEILVSIPVFSERINYYHQMKAEVDNAKGLFDLEAGAYFIPFTADVEDDPEEIEGFE
ncbi:MAG: FtsQ-type POTRA domain-containing protein [Alkalibacterium sp.]|uniref:cell division protein FtsQ/DivIB n=1 Tax=Alkalibacterium sp. TaxID=1872447 RepID=UPI003970F53D